MAAGDFDGDRDVDQEDFGHLQACFTAPGELPSPPCADANLDGDDAVDLADFAILRAYMSAPGSPP